MSGELSAEQLRARFEERVKPFLDSHRSLATGGQSWPPVVVYTGGQPGAGKSRTAERLLQLRPSLVAVIGDDLRQFHPDYARLMREDPLGMPAATAHASGQWVGMSAAYLREQRADVLIETTLRSPEAMASTIAEFRGAGYVVELRAVAVPAEVSRLSTVERYTGQVESVGAGRWTPTAAHDAAFAQGSHTVNDLVSAGAVDRFVVEDRAGAILFDRSYFGLHGEQLVTEGRAAAANFDELRSVDRLSPAQARDWLDLARDQLGKVSALQQSDPDLLATVQRIGTVDALAVAWRAHPTDAERRTAASRELAAVAEVKRVSTRPTPITRTSLPRPGDATRPRPTERPSPEAPRARTERRGPEPPRQGGPRL